MQQNAAFGAGKITFAHARAQLAFEMAVKGAERRVVELLLAARAAMDGAEVSP